MHSKGLYKLGEGGLYLAPKLPSHRPNPHARPSFSLISFPFTITLPAPHVPHPKRRPRAVPGPGNGRILGQPHKAEPRGPSPGSPPHPPSKTHRPRCRCPSADEAAPLPRRKKPPPPQTFNGPYGFGPLCRLPTALSPALPLPVSKSLSPTPPRPIGLGIQQTNGSRL